MERQKVGLSKQMVHAAEKKKWLLPSGGIRNGNRDRSNHVPLTQRRGWSYGSRGGRNDSEHETRGIKLTNANVSSNSSYSRAGNSQQTLNGDDSEGSRDVPDTSVFLRAMSAIDRSDTPSNRKATTSLKIPNSKVEALNKVKRQARIGRQKVKPGLPRVTGRSQK